MIVKKGKIVKGQSIKLETLNNSDYTYFLNGVIFVPGKRMQEESIAYIIEELINKGNKSIFNSIHGNYFLFINDSANNLQYAFVDNGGIFPAYQYQQIIGSSFLELVEFEPSITLDDICHNGIMDFLQLGSPYFNNTFIKGIKKIHGNQYFTWKNGQVHIEDKGIPDIDAQPTTDFDIFFKDLVYAIEGKKISLDITGGTDSRLILSYFLKHQVPFDVQTNGAKGNPDIDLAKNIAEKFNLNHYINEHTIEEISDNQLLEIFQTVDGLMNVLKYHPTFQANSKRKARNIEICINGNVGCLYKEFWWIHDFPFYNRKKTNLERLFDYRIRPIPFPINILGNKLLSYGKVYRAETLARLKPLVKGTNTQSFDNIYYKFKATATSGLGGYLASNKWFIDYSPLVELNLVRVGYHLNRGMRFFSKFHRKLISKNNVDLSRLKTNGRLTASYSTHYMILEFGNWVLDKFMRLLKQILRKIFKKTYFQAISVNKDIYDKYRKSAFFDTNLEVLKVHDLVNRDLMSNNVPDEMVGKILTLGMFISKLEKNHTKNNGVEKSN